MRTLFRMSVSVVAVLAATAAFAQENTLGKDSMTPNLDRLLQRSQPGVTDGGTSAYRPLGSTSYSKGSKEDRDDDRDRDNCDYPGCPGGCSGHYGGGDDDCDPQAPVPEPTTMLLVGGAAAAAGLRARAKRRKSH